MTSCYRLCGVVVTSDVPLPELEPASGAPSFAFELERSGRGSRRTRWYHHWHQPGEPRWLSFARIRSGYLLRFHGLAEFEIDRTRSHVLVRPRPDLPPDTLRHLLLDQVWPLVLSASGRLVIHASAVVLRDGRALAFAGAPGVGKSSLAARLASTGCRVLTDDCLLVERAGAEWRAVPSYPGLRLWPDMLGAVQSTTGIVSGVAHYTEKKRVHGAAVPFAAGGAPLRAVYAVHGPRPGAPWKLTPLRGAQAVIALVPLAYILDFEDRAQLERTFAGLAAFASQVPVFRLELAHTRHGLARLTAALTGPLVA